MSRTVQIIQSEYGQAAAELGQEVYLRSLAEENIEKQDYKIEKLKNRMQGLAKEAQALQAAQAEEKKEEAPVEQANS